MSHSITQQPPPPHSLQFIATTQYYLNISLSAPVWYILSSLFPILPKSKHYPSYIVSSYVRNKWQMNILAKQRIMKLCKSNLVLELELQGGWQSKFPLP
jgi:hypothetical protein